jgi:transposase-like protein
MATTGDIDAALAALSLQEKPNYSQVARDYNVQRLQLYRRYKRLCRSTEEAHEYQRLLSNEQQKVLVEHINRLFRLGIPPTPAMVRVFA